MRDGQEINSGLHFYPFLKFCQCPTQNPDSTVLRYFIFIFILVFPTYLLPQEQGGLNFPFNWGGGNPDSQSVDKSRQKSLQEFRTRMTEKSIEGLTEREVDQSLLDLGLPTSGSIYAKRQRLKAALSLDLIDTKGSWQGSSQPKSSDRIQIENAAEGELMSVDKTKGGVMVLRGKVRVKIGSGTLTAETVSIDSDRKEIYAEGGIEYLDGPARIKGDKFLYDFKLSRGVIYDTKASMYPSYFIGEKMKKLDETRYLLEMGYFTACNAEIPHYTFKADKIVIYEDQTVVASNLSYQIGGTTVFFFPIIYNSNTGNGFISQIGKNNSQGWFWQNSYQWADPYPNSLVLPNGYKMRFDMYEKTGQAVHLESWKVTPWLNYNLDLGYANHKRNQITPAYEDRFNPGGLGLPATTNQVDRGELFPNLGLGVRDVGVQYEPWWKTNLVLNAKQNDAVKDGTRNVQVRYENLNKLNFDYEYGYRYEPTNSIQGLYTQREQRFGLIRNILNWSFDYTENRGDLSVSLGAKRTLFYQIQADQFFPTVDQAPVLQIRNSSMIGTTPYFESPIYWDITFQNSTTKFYGPPVQKELPFPVPPNDSTFDPFGKYQDFVLRTQNLTQAETGFRSALPMGEYVTFTPGIYGGARLHTVDFPGSGEARNSPDNPSNVAQREFLAQDTYQYFRQNHELRVGVPALFFTTNYRKLDLEKPERRDPIFGRGRINEAEFALESYAIEDWEVSVRTIRDFRTYSSEYQPGPTEAERWYFTVFRVSGFFDFLDGFQTKRPTLLDRQRSFYSGIFINNDYIHHSAQARPLSNNLTLSYKMGGFSIPLVRNFRSFEAGATWYHVYGRNFLDSYRFFFRTDMKLTRNLGMDMELDSRVTEPWRLTQFDQFDYYNLGMSPDLYAFQTGTNYQRANIGNDIIQGTGAYGSRDRQKTIFNINRYMANLRYSLHNWEYRIGYSMNLRAFPGGATGDRQLTFYDQSVFVSATLTNFSLGEADAASTASRARIYRFRKQPLDGLGRPAGGIGENL